MKKIKYVCYILVLCLFLGLNPVKAEASNIVDVPQAITIKNALKGKKHPYLMGDNFGILRGYLNTDNEYKQRFNLFYRNAKQKLKKIDTVVLETMEDYVNYGEKEIVEFAFVYRMTGDTAFADATLKLLLQTIEISDWHTSNTIETASVSMVCAIGYDWIYDRLTPAERSKIPNAVWTKSLSLAYNLYKSPESGLGGMMTWAVTCNHNWSVVCNSGFGAAALGFMNDLDNGKAIKCSEMVAQGLNDVQWALAELNENGGWGEGVSYSQYAFLNFYKYISMLIEVTGDDYAILDYEPLKKNVMFPMYLTGSGQSFNFHDSTATYPDMINLMFAAKYYNDPSYAKLREKSLRIGAVDMTVFDLLWYVPYSENIELEPDAFMDEAVVMRKSFDDKNGIFAGLHGGQHFSRGQFINHGFMDHGTFVLDALGERWAEALGGDSYSLDGYHDRTNGGKRWNYYRCRAEGSNTLVINPSGNSVMDQVWGVNSPLTAQNLNGENPSASVDLTTVYADAKSAVRTLKLTDNRKNAELTDVIEMNKASEIYWFMHTKATITLSLDKKTATLKKGAKQIDVKLSSPSDAVFTVMDAKPLDTSPQVLQNTNSNYKKLAIHLTNTTKTTINVKFEPQYQDEVIEISDNVSDIFDDDFENRCMYPYDKTSGVFDLGYFKANVNKLSDYKELEIVQSGYDDRALLLRWISDKDAGQTDKLSGGIKLASEAGSFNPSGVTVIDFSIKSSNVSKFVLEARYTSGKYCNLFAIKGNQLGLIKDDNFIHLADASGDYQRVRIILDTNVKRYMLLVDNKLVYSESYLGNWEFGKEGLLRFQLTGGTAVSVEKLDYIYSCRVFIGKINIYTSDAYSYENMIAHKSKNGIRLARFESNLYNSNSAEMMFIKAKYHNDGLESIEKEDVTIYDNEEKYLPGENNSDYVYYLWDKNMMPYFKKIE